MGGKARAIGVCNFYPDRFMDIVKFSEITPMVNQIEVHVFQQQKLARKYLDKYKTQIEAWGPFARGANNMFSNPMLAEIGKLHGKTVGQTALRFLIQSGVVAIPKSVHKERMVENFNIFDFKLTTDEMKRIEALDIGQNVLMDHRDPDAVEVMFAKIDL